MNTPKDILFAAVGVGDLAISKARRAQQALDLSKLREFNLTEVRDQFGRATTGAITRTTRAYGDLVNRGQRTVTGIRTAAPTKRAVAQTKTARTQTKAAVTSAKKAASSTVEATRNAAASI